MRSKLTILAQDKNVSIHGAADTSDGFHVATIVHALFVTLGVKRGQYADFAKAVDETIGDPKMIVDLKALKEQL